MSVKYLPKAIKIKVRRKMEVIARRTIFKTPPSVERILAVILVDLLRCIRRVVETGEAHFGLGAARRCLEQNLLQPMRCEARRDPAAFAGVRAKVFDRPEIILAGGFEPIEKFRLGLAHRQAGCKFRHQHLQRDSASFMPFS